MKTLTNCADYTESSSIIFVPTYCFAVKALEGFSVSRLCTVNWVSESSFISLLVGFSKKDMTVKIHTSSSTAYQKGFLINNQLTETRYKISVSGFSKVPHN
jgi:hypothetical protein